MIESKMNEVNKKLVKHVNKAIKNIQKTISIIDDNSGDVYIDGVLIGMLNSAFLILKNVNGRITGDE